MADRPVILTTNDDGIQAEGLGSLARVLRRIGEVWTIAPDGERSATSHSLTLRARIDVRWLDERRAAVAGTPADAVLLAVRQLMPVPPEIVVSGINQGPNLGDDVNYSGTVGAAMEATILGIPALAVSLTSRAAREFDVAATVASGLARRILDGEGLPPGTMLNVNVPDVPAEELRGIKVTRLARRTYDDMIREEPGEDGKRAFWIGNGRPRSESAADADCAANREGWITLTPLRLDMTDHGFLRELRGWDLDLADALRPPAVTDGNGVK